MSAAFNITCCIGKTAGGLSLVAGGFVLFLVVDHSPAEPVSRELVVV